MENQRVLLYTGLAFLMFLLWQQWQTDYVLPKPTPVTQTTPISDTGELIVGGSDNAPAVSDSIANVGDLIEVKTDVVEAWISKTAGNIVKLSLNNYSVALDQPDVPFTLLDHQIQGEGEEPLFHVAQSGLLSLNRDLVLPDHKAQFQAQSNRYTLEGDRVDIPLVWEQDGVKVTKTIGFKRGSYVVDISYQIEGAPAGTRVKQYLQIKRTEGEGTGGIGQTYSYTGGVYSHDADPYEKLSFSDMNLQELADAGKPARKTITTTDAGWVAMIQHYFAVAALPNQSQRNTLEYSYRKQQGTAYYNLVAISEDLAAEDDAALVQQFFIGPKIEEDLAAAAKNLPLTVDFGMLSFVSVWLFQAMKFFYGLFGNWGWSIVAVTVCIKALFYPLSKMSYTSMAKMKKLTPKVQAIREQHKGDQAKLGAETMALYKREKVNPLGGCLPILVQFPIFLGLYWMLSEVVELRQAPWIFWIEDLSIRDQFFVLPIIYMATMFIQQRLNPPPADPIQAKLFKWMPIMFGVFFMFFPAGLVLYWVVNNTLTISQQWMIMRNLEKADLKKAG